MKARLASKGAALHYTAVVVMLTRGWDSLLVLQQAPVAVGSRRAAFTRWLVWSGGVRSGKRRSSCVKAKAWSLAGLCRGRRLARVSNSRLGLPKRVTLETAKSCQLGPPLPASLLFPRSPEEPGSVGVVCQVRAPQCLSDTAPRCAEPCPLSSSQPPMSSSPLEHEYWTKVFQGDFG